MLVSLTGGLGNQLFQFYAGLCFTEQQLGLTDKFGNPRSTGGVPDLFHFKLPSRVTILNNPKDDSNLKFRLGRVAIRRNLIPSQWDNYSISRWIRTGAIDVCFSVLMKKKVRVFSSNSVGYSNIRPTKQNLLFGYFQTYKYLDSLNEADKEIVLLKKSSFFESLSERARSDRPLVVHVRLTDYLKEHHFGTLDFTYYRECLQKLQDVQTSISNRPIWLFSDDPEAARGLIPTSDLNRLFVVPKFGLTPAETLELMRYGSAYIIANSTFSWWGAKMSYAKNPPVIAPSKWFVGMKDPENLLPSEWIIQQR